MMAHLRVTLVVCIAAITGAACSGDGGMRCEDPGLYRTSSSASPVRVPDDLSVPDESQALQIPPGEPLPIRDEDDPPPCLELPPDFFDENQQQG